VAVCRRAGGADGGAGPVLAGLKGADARRSGSLLGVLARLGGPKALAAVRSAAKDTNADVRTAAIRALAEWQDAAPLEDLLAIAQSPGEPVGRVLALRGFAKLSAKAADRKPEELAAMFERAMKLAERPEEKRALLGGLGAVACPAAMRLACGQLEDRALVNEAGMAVVKIAGALWKSRPAEAKAALEQVSAAGVAAHVRAEAAGVLLELSKPRNYALDAKATSPDGLDSDGAASGDQAAIDGNPETYWDEQDGAKLYRLVVTFPQPTKLAVIRITGYQHHNYAPKDFDVLCDGKAVKSVRNAQYDDNRLTVAFPQTQCTSLELKITGYYGRSPAVRELEAFGLEPGRP
jgi:hypothetical protein